MPYKRQSRSTRYMRKSGDAIQVASKALSTAYAVKKLLNVEKKVFDLNHTTSPPVAGNVTPMSLIQQSDLTSGRSGNSVLLKSVQLRGHLTSTVAGQSARLIIVRDTDNQGATPSVADILSGSAIESPMDIITYPNRFKVLWDKTYDLSNSGVTRRSFKMFKAVDFHLKFHSTGGGAADTRDNALYLLTISAGSGTVPTTAIHTRLRFIDN